MKLKTILANDLCTGCGLCASVHNDVLRMEMNVEGFLRPRALNTSAMDTELPFCPGAGLRIENNDGDYYLNWGRLVDCKVGYSTTSEVRYKGSSGGVLSQVAIYLLERNMVDGVIHIGVDENNPLINVSKVSRNSSEVVSNAGSRYAPAAPLDMILQTIAVDNNAKYAFIGKPCDVAALRTYLETHPEIKPNLPYLVSFMCAGTPSIVGTDEVLKKLNVKKEDLISFRYRGDGWPGVTKAIDKDQNESTMTYNESWGNVLGRYLQKRCKLCPDGIGEFADIVCGDAWHGDENGYPDFEEKEGRSLILIRTRTGNQIIKNMLEEGAIEADAFNVDSLNIIQPAQRHRRQSLLARLVALKVMFKVIPVFSGFYLYKGAKSLTFKRNLLAFMGMLLRIYRRKV